MKVKLTIELELPECTDMTVTEQQKRELDQTLYDGYVHYVTCSHLRDALTWCAKGKVGSDNEDTTAKAIYEHHDRWATICSQSKWQWEIVK